MQPPIILTTPRAVVVISYDDRSGEPPWQAAIYESSDGSLTISTIINRESFTNLLHVVAQELVGQDLLGGDPIP